jgi:response regulator RpfG family c-di-GMP phosphodiesterase
VTEKILFVDDEPNVLAGLERQLRGRYAVKTAPGGEAGLAAIAADGAFAVIVSDMRMPGMNGTEFLAEARKRQPDAVRLLLTGYAEVQSAIDAVNRVGLFRFLTKPCDAGTLTVALDAALAQYRLVTAERELLDRTLRGSVQVLGEVLALANPAAFGRALRVQGLVRELAAAAGAPVGWEADVAAVLTQLGSVAVPERVLALADRGKDLTADEQAQLDAGPQVAAGLVARIPRLEGVVAILGHLGPRPGSPGAGAAGLAPPPGALLLRLARDLDALLVRGIPRPQAVEYLKRHPGRYGGPLLDGLDRLVRRQVEPESRTLPVADLAAGMVLEEDLYSLEGQFLLRHGNPITEPVKVRLERMAAAGHVHPTIRVLVPPGVGSGQAAPTPGRVVRGE